MWCKYDADAGSLLTVIEGRRVNLKPGAIIKVSDEAGTALVAKFPAVVEVGDPDAIEPEVVEQPEAVEPSLEPTPPLKPVKKPRAKPKPKPKPSGAITADDLSAGGRKQK